MRDGFFEAMLWLSGWNLWAGLILFPALLFLAHRVPPRARTLWLLGSAGFCVFFILKWTQHFLFQNRAFDLGMYTNVAWSLSVHGSYWDSITGMNDLGDHFSPFLAILAPAMRIVPSDLVLTAFQSAALALSVFPLHRLAGKRLGPSWAAAVCALYLAHPRLHGIHFYDFHIISFAVPCFLWLLLALEEGRWRTVMLLGSLALGIREDVSLAVFGVGAYIAITQKGNRRHGIGLMAVSVLWMYFLQKWAMPYFLGDPSRSRNLTFFFTYLGNNFSEALFRLQSDPISVIRGILSDPVRYRGMGMYLLSFGFLPLLKPRLAWMWIFPVGMYFCSDYYNMNQFRFQYSALSFPFLVYASLDVVAPALRPLSHGSARILAGACVSYSLLFLPHYFQADHRAHVRALERLVREVPAQASVSAETHIVPRLASRDRIFMFPTVPPGTEYVALDTASPVLRPEDIRHAIGFARKFHDRIVFSEAGVYLLRSGKN